MKMHMRFDHPGCADGIYSIEARGFILAVLRWADDEGICPDWTSLACVPLDALGCGAYRLTGGRAVPPGITRIAAELISADFKQRDTLFYALPEAQRTQPIEPGLRLMIMSDLHLSSKDSRTRWALRRGRDADCVLLAGDMTNDGLPEQFESLRRCIEEELPDIPVLAVAGNHDYPRYPLPLVEQGVYSYLSLQSWLLRRAQRMGVSCHADENSAYSAIIGNVEILGLNAVTHWRRFAFPGGSQPDWLENRLHSSDARRRIVLCHAPLLMHNPQRTEGSAPYLSRDRRLQEIMDAASRAIFVSGHTHISMNEPAGCVDTEGSNIFINDSSVVATMMHNAEAPGDREWVEGAVLLLNITDNAMELRAQAMRSRKWIARGYYRWAND